mgnify:FL=1
MRHGHALSPREAGVLSDSERPLSPLGEKEALETSLHLNASGFVPDFIISSPFLRAGRTAAIAAGIFPSAPLKTDPALSDGQLQALLELILRLSTGESSALLVGHQPLIGAGAGFLLGMNNFDLPPAGFVRIKSAKEPGFSSLVEFYVPPQPEKKDGGGGS